MAELLGLIGGVVGPLLVLILLVVPLIVVHELGHLLVARWRGIAVEDFGIGFPPRIAVLHRGSRTLLTLNALPFGGFVRMAGATEGSSELDGWERASLLSKTMVMLAGVLVNLLLAFALMLLLAGPLAERGELTLDAVQPGSPAATAGIVASDKIAALNGVPFDRFETPLAEIRSLAGEQVSLTIVSSSNVTLSLIHI
jgi:regulator of sigma E protease